MTFARGLGGTLLGLGVVLGVVLAMSSVRRGWRWFCLVLWVVGGATSIAAGKGMCVVLHGLRHRHVRPWEIFQLHSPSSSCSPHTEHELANVQEDALNPRSVGRNDATTRFWMERYARKGTVRKIFDREVWVQEPALRQVQDKIFVQAVVVASLGGLVVTSVLVFAIPKGKLF